MSVCDFKYYSNNKHTQTLLVSPWKCKLSGGTHYNVPHIHRIISCVLNIDLRIYRLCCDDGFCVGGRVAKSTKQQRTKNKTNIGQHSWKVLPNFANIAGEDKQQQSSNISGAAAWLASLYLTIVQLQSPLSQPSFLLSLPLAFSFAKHHATYAKSGTEEKRKRMNVSTKRVTHTLLLATIHTHSQALIQSQLTEIGWFRRCMPRSCCACPTTATTTPATQAGRVSRAWLGPLHTAGEEGMGEWPLRCRQVCLASRLAP